MIDIELQRTRSAMAESVTLPIATWLEVLDELESLRQAASKTVSQEPMLCVECGKPTMHVGNKCYPCCQEESGRSLEYWDGFNDGLEHVHQEINDAAPFGFVSLEDNFNYERTDEFDVAVYTAPQPVATEQEPVAIIEKEAGFETEVYATGHADSLPDGVFKLYAAPARTKDLTDDEIRFWIGRFPFLLNEKSEKWVIGLARAVIAKFKEKNK